MNSIKARNHLLIMLAMALTLPVATMFIAQAAGAGRNAPPSRPQGPCDVYATGGTPCVAAHSSTRALYAAYNGPLYQVLRQSDGKTLDIGVVKPSAADAGGYADAAAQDAFCANTYCWITTLYDQSGHRNHLVQAPRGGTGTPTVMGGFNSLPIADMAPVTIMGHKAYGVFIENGMGMRQNNAHGTAVDDQAEGQYWVVNGQHYNSGCCFDYGNGETDSRDDGDGTMETTYFGNAKTWYHGPGDGPWIMTDQENNLVGCVTDSPQNKNCDTLPIIKWRFVAATADGEPHHWRTMGGDAQSGEMAVMFDGPRVKNNNNSYDPMRKQGAILLGNGGDNSNSAQGTFYEGAMTAAGTFPSKETNQKLQANIVAARYDEPRLTLAPAAAVAAPPGLQTFSPGSAQDTTVTFKNTTGAPVTNVKLALSGPRGWSTAAATPATIAGPVAPGASVTATFKVTSGSTTFNGDLVAEAAWNDPSGGPARSDKAVEKVRNVSPVKLNEFSVSATTPFIELYNAGDNAVDLSNWTLTEHAIAQAIFSSVKIPAGTKLAAKGFYLLGQSNSGLAVPARKGDTVLHVRSVTGMNVGDTVEIDTGSGVETRKIAGLGTAAGTSATLWQPLPDGPVITIAPGATTVPVASVNGFTVGEKIGLGHGATYPVVARDIEQYEVVTVTAVGKPGTQTALGAAAKAGDSSIQAKNAANITAGDRINLDIDSVGHGTETVTVKTVTPLAGGGAPPAGGRGGRGGGGGATLELAAPLKFDHSSNLPFSVRGTGLTFQPAAAFAHSSNEPVLPLGTGITLDKPLERDHTINAVVRDASVTAEGYQGNPAPNQWFGGPALGGAGNLVLRDAGGLVVDSLNYGLGGNNNGIIDPWANEGYQGTSAAGVHGCYVASPAPAGGRGGRGAPPPATPAPSRSAGRTADGADTDSNCTDFQLQAPTPGAANQRAQ
ncbi:MAG: arabinofuranosidase catalytic domain-containing protein [Verrucomicrobiota bacterium]